MHEKLFSEGLLKPMSSEEMDVVDAEALEEDRAKAIESIKKNRKLINGKWTYTGDLDLEYLNLFKIDDILKDYPIEVVEGALQLTGNPLITLNGLPRIVTDGILLSDSPLKSLKCDHKIETTWVNIDNIKITDFKDFPFIAYNSLNITIESMQSLTSLEGLPKECSTLVISHCNNLRTLEGCPEKIENFSITFCNKLMTLDGIAKKMMLLTIGNLPSLIDLNGLEDSTIEVIRQYKSANMFSRMDLPYKIRMSVDRLGDWK